MNGKCLLITSILCVIFLGIGVLIGGSVIWKNFKADQEWIKNEIIKIQEDERLAKAIMAFLEELEGSGITLNEWIQLWAEQ